MRRYLVVIEAPEQPDRQPEEWDAILRSAFSALELPGQVARVRRGGLLAMKVMEELPPPRHRHAERGG